MTSDQPPGTTRLDPDSAALYGESEVSGDPEFPGDGDAGAPYGPVVETRLASDDEMAAGPSTRRWRFAPRSLTVRLVVGVVALVAIVVVATGIGTYIALRSFLYQRLDQQLQQTAAGQNAIRRLFNNSAPQNPTVSAPTPVWAVALTPSGAFLTDPVSTTVRPMKLTALDRRRIVRAGSGSSITVETTDGVQLRVTSQPAVAGPDPLVGPGVPAIAVIGLSTDELNRTLDHLLNLEIVIGASAMILALVATSGGVRFSLRRLHRISRTAQEVAAELSPEGAGLDRRVPVTDPGTEVGRLAESMNTLLSAVETQFAARLDNERRMRQFLADASHELRTPLTSIRGYAELARMQRAVGDSDEGNLERIESEGTRMSRLVEDLLTLARGDQGALPERVLIDVTELLDDVATSARAAFPGRRIGVEGSLGLHLVGDHDQLLRVVRNLVTNAVVHTRPDGAVTLRGFSDGAGVVVQVIDQGPGLPPEQAQHVFERFWRADKARTRARGGSGLGLAIVTSVVRAHGGTVHFASSVELGSTVTVWLPVAGPA
jgi:two-component system OmpR family sensor kinase